MSTKRISITTYLVELNCKRWLIGTKEGQEVGGKPKANPEKPEGPEVIVLQVAPPLANFLKGK